MTTFVFLFPGQGSQSLGMGKELCTEFSEAQEIFDEASETLGFNMSKLCFEDPEGKLNLTEFTQPAILTLSIATQRVLEKRANMKSSFVAGHSLGEYSALVCIGALSFSDALKAVHFRGKAMQRAVPVGMGSMAAYLGTAGDKIPEICKEISSSTTVVEVVNFNSPGQLVLSGHKVAVEKACEVIAEKKLGKAKVLQVSAPFHSSLMKPAAHEMQQYLMNVPLHAFPGKIVANVDAQVHTASTYTKEMLVKQIASPVLWTQSLLKIDEILPETCLVEVGPGKVLQGLAKKTIETKVCLGTHDLASLKVTMNAIAG